MTVVAIADSWASLPFNHYAKLYVSDLRNDYEVQGGRSFLLDSNVDEKTTKAEIVNANLKQLGTLEPGNVKIVGSYDTTTACNRLLVLISVARDSQDDRGPTTSLFRSAIQVFLKLSALTIYVFATSIFAAVTLLALPMAQMILMLVVGAGILGRVLVGNIAHAIKQQNSVIHVIADSEQEAAGFVARVFEDQKRPGIGTNFQIEIDGHVFVNQIRIKSRSPWPVRILGVLAKPYELTRVRRGALARHSDLTRVRHGYAPLDREVIRDEGLEMNPV